MSKKLSRDEMAAHLRRMDSQIIGGRGRTGESIFKQAADLLDLDGVDLQSARKALADAAATFRGYAVLHSKKGTPEGDVKAAKNAKIAEEIGGVADMLSRDLRCPISELSGTLPVVVYFKCDKDRDEFIEACKAAMPGAAMKKL